MPGLKLLQYENDTKAKVCESLHKTEDDLNEQVQELREWIRTQEKIPKDISTHKLEAFIILNKFKSDRIKNKVKQHFDLRSTSRYYKSTVANNEMMLKQMDLTTIIPLPKLLHTYRIFVMKILNPSTKDFDIHESFSCLTCQGDVILEYDYHQSSIIVIDASNVTFGHVRQGSYKVLSECYRIFTEGFSGRIASFHILNINFAVRGMLYLVKLILKPKLADRIYIHNSLESLYEVVPKSHLPEDFGGSGKPIKDLVDEWKDLIMEFDPWLKKLREMDDTSLHN